MDLPQLKIGNFVANLPIIQGGMSVKNSMAGLAAAVSNAGGIGVIGASGISAKEVAEEIRKMRDMTDGIVAINVMYAISNFVEVVKESVQAGVDIIFTGAGFSKDIYKMVKDTGKAVASIVSSAKAGMLAERLGADAVVVEGTEAGGHLGTMKMLDEIFPQVVKAVKSIPVIAAGGIIDGFDIAKYLKMGAAGVQMATRFICSKESGVPESYKQAYLNATEEDIVLIESPVGFPGRAIRNKLVEKIEDGTVTFNGCKKKCLKICSYKYCINEKLINAMEGDIDDGLIFAGAGAWKINDILPVAEIMQRLVGEVHSVPA